MLVYPEQIIIFAKILVAERLMDETGLKRISQENKRNQAPVIF